MANDEIKAQKKLYKAHLEFLGYSVEGDPNNEQLITATLQKRSCDFYIMKKGIRASIIFETSEYARNNRLELLEFANKANQGGLVRNFIFDNGNFCISMFLFGPYERTIFGDFVDLFIEKVTWVFELPNAGKILSN